jgi:cytidylate kinase
MRKIFCIGREFGSGGLSIAKEAAKALNINCYDREILDEAVRSSGLPKEHDIVHMDEKAPSAWMYSILYEGSDRRYYGMISNDVLFSLEKKIILAAAEREDCIIVGRCADNILKQCRDYSVLSIFVTAYTDDRVKAIMERKEVNEGTAKDLIRKTDKERRVYYKTYTGKEWGISSSYDLTLNSSTLSRAAIIDILKYLYNNEMNG